MAVIGRRGLLASLGALIAAPFIPKIIPTNNLPISGFCSFADNFITDPGHTHPDLGWRFIEEIVEDKLVSGWIKSEQPMDDQSAACYMRNLRGEHEQVFKRVLLYPHSDLPGSINRPGEDLGLFWVSDITHEPADTKARRAPHNARATLLRA